MIFAQGLDSVLHCNPAGGADGEKGLFFVFNPTGKHITANLSVPLYYTGLSTTAAVAQGTVHNGATAAGVPSVPREVTLQLRRDYSISLPVAVAAHAYAYYTIA